MGHFLLHARQVPDGQAAGGLGGTIAPGIGGSAVASATASVDDSGLAIDPDLANAPIPTVPIVTQPTSSIPNSSDTPLPSDSSTSPSSSKSNNTTTIVIVAVAAVAFLLIGVAILVLFYRSNKKKRRQSRRGHWREIESHQSYAGQGPAPPMHPGSHYGHGESHEQFQPHPEGGMFETKSMYSTRRSVDAPPSLKLSFPTNEPLMSNNPFVHAPSPGSPVPPLPHMPAVQHVQQPQQIMVQHQADPPSAGFSAPSEYTASYIRSVYSTTGDVQSIAESTHSAGTHPKPRSRSNTLKRGPDRSKNQHELIALDNLIAALDLTEEKQAQTLPEPSLFRAALGGQQQQQTPQQHPQQPQQYY